MSSQWEADCLDAARQNHIWLNAMQCSNPSKSFVLTVGRAVLLYLNNERYLIKGEPNLGNDSQELIVRINKS